MDQVQNNRFKRADDPIIRRVNSTLKTNRRILKRLYDARRNRTNSEALMMAGFKLNFVTHLNMDQDNIRMFCYEYGLELIKPDEYLLVKDRLE